MKIKLILFSSLFLFSVIVKSQVVLENLTEYEAVDFNIYKLGDTIVLNQGSYSGQYSSKKYFEYIFNSGFSVKNEIKKNTRMKISKELQDKYSLKNQRVIIKDIIKRVKGENEIVYIVVLRGFIKDYIDLDQAIITKEIVKENTQYMQFFTNHFDEKAGYLYYLGLKELNDQDILEYMYRFEKKKFNLFKDDEFEFQDKKEETKEIIQKEIKKLRAQKESYIYIKVKYDKYNFENSSFKSNINNSTGYSIIEKNTFLMTPQIKTFTTLSINFNNATEYSDIKVNKEQAKVLIESKKNKEGKIDRTLFTKVIFKIDDKLTVDSNTIINDNYIFIGEIVNIEYYADKNYKELIYKK